MTDQTRVFQLERLYVALAPAQDGKPPALQVLARTPGVKPEQLTECWRMAQLMPPPAMQVNEAMPGSFGIFRGETAEYIIAKAQMMPNGAPQFQYLLAPSAAIRAIGGNVRFWESYGREPIPQFASPRTDLPPFMLDHPEPADAETQTADLEALMDYCKFDLNVVSGLLAGVVEAMGIGVINAPNSLHDRLSFVQGILTMLPIPARVGITFATSVIDPAQTNTQIKFLASDLRPGRHLIFDWAAGKLLSEAPDDVYAKFILSQLRLDTSLVLEQTAKLSRTAVWRAMRKDDMANALAWASRRASLDSAVLDGQPADRAMVAGVLREDPTLPDDLRISYAHHLLRLSLALDDPSSTDIVPKVAATNRELAEKVFEQLRTAIEGENPMAVYHLVERWITNPPASTDLSRWRPLLGMALLARTNALITGEPEPLIKFLEQFLNVPPALELDTALQQVIEVSRRRGDNPDIARMVFLLSAIYLPAGEFQAMLSTSPAVSQLPQALRDVLPHMISPRVKSAPPSLLVKAAEAFGQDYQWVVLARLVEWALFLQRFDLIDFDVLRGITKLAVQPQGRRFDELSQHLIEAISAPQIVRGLEPKTPQYLVELSLAYGRNAEAIRLLEIYQNTLYKGTNQEDMAEIARSVFHDLPLSAAALNEALAAMQDSQLKPIARVNAYIGALESKNYGPEMEPTARKFTAMLFADPRLTALIGIEPVLRLLKANADRKDAMESVRLASAMVEYAVTLAPDQGPELIQQVYPLINWNPEVKAAALEILRTYVRRAPLALAQDLPTIMGNKYGEDVHRALDAAYRLRLMLGGSDFMSFAEQVHAGWLLLNDMALVYYEKHELPPIHKLRRAVEGLPGGITEEQRKRLSANLNSMGIKILNLAQIANKRKARNDNQPQLLKGEITPTTGLEALLWIGGLMSNGKAHPLSLEHEAPAFIFGSRSVNMLLRETDLLVRLLDGLIEVFPENDTTGVDLAMWTAEIQALWALLTLYKQRQISPELAEDAQLLSQVIKVIGDKGNERSFQSGGYGRQLQTGRAQPRSVIEALRWVSGYFGREHN